MLFRGLSLVLLALLALPQALFADEFVVRDIRVEGLDRISRGTVFSDLPIVVGDRVDTAQSSLWIKALYGTGYFEDVRVALKRDVVVFSVSERPGIASIVFAGNKDISDEQLTEVLDQAGISVREVFNRHFLELLTQGLTEQYQALGNFNVRVGTRVHELPENRVQLEITVDEGEVSKIRRFEIMGNRKITDKELFKSIESGTAGWYEFWSSRDDYSRLKLAGDIEAIRSVYLNRGFLDFEVTGTRVSLHSNKQDIYVEITVDEGEQYRIGDVSLSCRPEIRRSSLAKHIDIRKGELFSRADILASSGAIELELKNSGYAGAKVNAVPDQDSENRTVDIVFLVNPGRKTYVRRINLTGNHGTSDETFRRELRQLESGEYSARNIELSKRRLQRLPYVQSAEVEVLPIKDETGLQAADDQVDLNFHVEESRSGNVNLGAGYSDAEGAVISFSLNQDNFLGTGNRVGFVFNNSNVNTNYTVSFFDPYYTLDGISRSWSVLYRSIDNAEQDINNTETDEARVHLGFGVPLSENDTLNVGLSLQNIDLSPGDGIGARLRNYYEDQCGWTPQNRRLMSPRVIRDCSFFNLVTTTSFDYDTRDRSLFPTEGSKIRGSLQVFVPIDGLAYYKLDYFHRYYQSLSDNDDYVFAGKTRVSYANRYGKTIGVPPYDRFFAGGASSLRGYFNNSLGPQDVNGDPLGGDFRVLLGTDLYFPTDFLYDRQRLRVSAFVDYGNVFENVGEFSVTDMRGSYGLHLRWLTAVGSISLSFASHFKDQAGDETESFQFDLGGNF